MDLNQTIPETVVPKQPPQDLPTEDRVRQGVTGHGVRYVLALSLLGAIIAMMIVAVILAN